MTEPLGDEDLVAAFLEATEDMSVAEAGDLIEVSHATVARWRNGDWVRIYPSTARRIRAFLADRSGKRAATETPYADGMEHVVTEMERLTERIRDQIMSARKIAHTRKKR